MIKEKQGTANKVKYYHVLIDKHRLASANDILLIYIYDNIIIYILLI